MKNKCLLLLVALFTTLSTTVFAQEKTTKDDSKIDNLLRAAIHGWHIRLGAGFNIGGAAPLPLPAEIRSIDGYNPGMNIALEGAVHKQIDKTPWGILLGVRFEKKGMTTDATVKNYHMEAVNDDGSGTVIGAWTGEVRTELDNNYLTFPILATYNVGKRWQLSAGPYLSWMFDGQFTGAAHDGYIRDQNPTGEKAEVNRASYNFSKNLRKFHWGVQVGGEFKAYKHLGVFANLQWGLNGIFPEDFNSVTFELYPIYANIGFNYLF